MFPNASPTLSSGPDLPTKALRLLSSLGLALLCLQLVLCAQVSFDDLRFSALCAAALGSLFWARRASLSFEGDPLSATVGFSLISFVLARTLNQPGALFASLAPLFWGMGWALFGSGFRGLGQYWREAIVLAGMAGTPFLETLALEIAGVDLAPITAQAAAFLLRLGGLPITAHDALLGIPSGWLLVSQGCSGLKTMYFLAGFAAITLLLFPIPGLLRKAVIVLSAAGIGFVVNAVRVAMLALLATPGHRRAFEFWHIKQGTMIIEIVAVIAFLAFFSTMIPQRRSPAVNC